MGYYGYYSCRARGERKKLALQAAQDQPAQLARATIEPKRSPSATWARCIKQVYENDPLECPKCKSLMRIIAFVQNPLEIKKIMQSLCLPDYTAPPSLAKSSCAQFEQYCLDELADYETFDT